MIKVTQYQAFDGTLFGSEDECFEYERKSKLVDNAYLQVWDRKKRGIVSPPLDLKVSEVWYIKCNKEGMDYFNYLCDNDDHVPRIINADNLYNYSDILYWCWDEDRYKWVNFDAQIQYVKDHCKMFDIPLED